MAFWIFVALVLAVFALRRALRAEYELSELRREMLELRRKTQTLADRLGERWPGAAQPAASPSAEGADAASAEAPTAEAPSAEPLPGEIGVAPPDVAAPVPEATSTPPLVAVPTLASDADTIESDIGGRWLLYIGIAALVLGASYFLKYAFDNEWIGVHARVLFGVVGGLALTLLGQRFVRRGHVLYGQALCGGGLGIVYLSIYAANRWYEILSSGPAFVAMVMTTAAAAWLADRQRSQALALLAVIVGFSTPFLVGDDDSAHVTLFTYDAILVTGTLYLARRRAWPALNLVSYLLTVLTLVVWADRAYRPALYFSVELFLTLFLVLFLLMLRENRRVTTPSGQLATMMLALAPVLYHFASLVNLRPRLGPLFVYLIAFSVAGIIAAGQFRAAPSRGAWLRVLVFAGVAVPFMGLADRGFPRGWIAAAWTTTIAIYGAHLAAQIDALSEDRERMSASEILLLHVNGLWLLFCLQSLIAPHAQVWSAPVAFGLAAWYGVLAFAARGFHREAMLHAIALASALTAIACAIQFDGPWLVVAIAMEGAVLVWLALTSQRLWLRLWGGALIVLAIVRAMALLTEPVPISYLPLMNPRTLSCLFIVMVLYALAWFHGRDATTSARPLPRHALIIAANVLTLVILSAEIDAFFDRRAWSDGAERGVAGAETTAALSRQLTLSILWALYAVVLVAIGIWRAYRPVRYLAMLIFAFTIAKVFLVDLATLDRVYKMASVMGLGILLLIASYLYQRLRTTELASKVAE